MKLTFTLSQICIFLFSSTLFYDLLFQMWHWTALFGDFNGTKWLDLAQKNILCVNLKSKGKKYSLKLTHLFAIL